MPFPSLRLLRWYTFGAGNNDAILPGLIISPNLESLSLISSRINSNLIEILNLSPPLRLKTLNIPTPVNDSLHLDEIITKLTHLESISISKNHLKSFSCLYSSSATDSLKHLSLRDIDSEALSDLSEALKGSLNLNTIELWGSKERFVEHEIIESAKITDVELIWKMSWLNQVHWRLDYMRTTFFLFESCYSNRYWSNSKSLPKDISSQKEGEEERRPMICPSSLPLHPILIIMQRIPLKTTLRQRLGQQLGVLSSLRSRWIDYCWQSWRSLVE